MTDVAIKPDPGVVYRLTRPLAEVYVFEGKKYNDERYKTLYGRTREYNQHLAHRWFVTVALVGAPVSFIWLSLLTLIGYVALGLIPVAIASYNRAISTKYNDKQAYEYYHRLEGKWADFGHAFYTQVWEHDCAGLKADPSDYYTYDKYGSRVTKNTAPAFTTCRHCDDRIVELKELYVSQRETKNKVSSESSGPLFEASREFRKAITETTNSTGDKLMKEISDSV